MKKLIALLFVGALTAAYAVLRQQEKKAAAEADLWAEADAAA